MAAEKFGLKYHALAHNQFSKFLLHLLTGDGCKKH